MKFRGFKKSSTKTSESVTTIQNIYKNELDMLTSDSLFESIDDLQARLNDSMMTLIDNYKRIGE